MTRTRRTTCSLIALAVTLITSACAPIVRPARLVSDDAAGPPRIVAPGVTVLPPLLPLLPVDPSARPLEMRGWLPARVGDPVAVVLTPKPGKTPTAEAVRDEIIAPLVGVMRFAPGIAALRTPPSAGIALPQPRFAPLAQAVAIEYAANPKLLRPETHELLEVFLGKREADADVDRALLLGEGMTFAQFKAGIERREIVYPFAQIHRHPVHGAVPIEHAMLLATAWEGESVRSVQGVLLGDYLAVNNVGLDPGTAVARALRSLRALRGVGDTGDRSALVGPALVLLPFGTDAKGRPLLRYAYRMTLRASWRGQPAAFLLWADADSGKLLAMEPTAKAAGASGPIFNRDPSGGTVVVPFPVDDAVDGTFVLAYANASARLSYRDSSRDSARVAVPATGALANFNQSPVTVNVPADVMCAAAPPTVGDAPNLAFEQVNVFATLMRHRETVLGGGIFEPYPTASWSPTVESGLVGCNAHAGSMSFAACDGYWSGSCPNAPGLLLNFAHDNTMVAHELGHTANSRLVEGRPFDWCHPGGAPDCTLPMGWGNFHDLADFWAAHLESTSCIGGWVGKNLDGTDANLGCPVGHHNERGGFPRKLEVTAGATTGDHFPEHRASAVGGVGEYADGQIAGAALWEVRTGMRSKCRPSGVPQFGVRLQRALIHSGFFTAMRPLTSDLEMYQRLLELLFKLTEQWATAGSPNGPPAFAHNGAHTTNKVTAGFARAGIFLVPWQCLDADPSNDGILDCPAANPGADAVIDVDDNDTTDDDPIVDRDFLRDAPEPRPIFHVWTGPRYRLDGLGGGASMPGQAPCNDEFMVEVAADPAFTSALAQSPWTRVNHHTDGTAPTCYGTWPLPSDKWDALRAGSLPKRIYYRAWTRDVNQGTVRVSTEPGRLWTVPPPYAVVTTDGRSDY